MISLEQIAHQCDKVRWNGKDSFTARCVAHDDRNPSMSVTERDGMILAHCHAGCPQDVLIDILGIVKTQAERVQHIPRPRPAVDTSRTEARAKRAVEISTPAPYNHDYLVKKGIQPHGIGVLGGLYKDLPGPVREKGYVLVIPLADVAGKILSCQFIAEDGSKAYMAGSKRKGGFYFIKGNDRLWICEGFATGASLHEDTGDSVACAFDTGGLMPVTGALTALYPRRDILIMADDDWQSVGNPGFTKAREAAQVNGIKVKCPIFDGLNRGPKDTDYNDLRRLRREK
jgi:putative DNA primase/helicase